MMNKITTLLVFCMGATQLFAQTLFTYGLHPVSKDEFLRAYNKNKTPVTNKEQSLREYLDLYIKFKLKVKTAAEQKLDTLEQLKYEMQNFRSQVADAYMNDEKGLNTLIDEALERSRKDIRVMHFYVNIDPAKNLADTLKAYKAMNDLAGLLKTGGTSDIEAANKVSSKDMLVKAEDVGYVTALSLPYDIENLVYDLKPGAISGVIRRKTALHLFKNIEERKPAGKWKVAQILLSIPPNVSSAEVKKTEARADSIYKLLMDGADFATLAKQLSDDKLTYMNGGEMPEFGTGKFELPFETKVFELKKDGEISKPIVTGYGYHIVKRLQKRAIPADKNDELFVTNLKQQILQDSRMNKIKENFLKTIKQKTGYKKNALVKDSELFRYADSVVVRSVVGNYPVNNKTIFSFAKWNVKGVDWLNFIKDYKLNTDVYKGESNNELLDKFITTSSFEYYRKHLEEYSNDFKYQMQEFKEGNMLFEIMERNIWNKASNDSMGLLNYYNAHKTNYKWAASANVLLFNCSDAKVAENAVAALQNGKSWNQIAEDNEGKLQADSGRYEIVQLPLPVGTMLKEGLISTPVSSGDNTSGFVKVLRMFPANDQRSFNEAKGMVINDYQSYLEEKWLEILKKKYPVKVNEAVFKTLLN
ncbi:MAG: peptidylprolyl isomerase [Ferruginibacter sp.]